ncbi:MAG: hypothetical protein EON98_00120 [Chitinophagaceae bacterium]|nr:MAG: hypothetical protein EON98_00120 [Chitinophagaceae bacterium]
MKIKINQHTTIEEVQHKFHVVFPFLKIEFSNFPHQPGEATTRGQWYGSGIHLLEVASKPQPGEIIVQGWQKTGFVEKRFDQLFGLYPQIFRLDEGRWIQSAGTDIFTLDEQNEIGRKLIEKSSGTSHLEAGGLL